MIGREIHRSAPPVFWRHYWLLGVPLFAVLFFLLLLISHAAEEAAFTAIPLVLVGLLGLWAWLQERDLRGN